MSKARSIRGKHSILNFIKQYIYNKFVFLAFEMSLKINVVFSGMK